LYLGGAAARRTKIPSSSALVSRLHGLAPTHDPQLCPQLWLHRRELLFSFLLLGLVESDSSPARSVMPAVQRKEISLPESDAAQLGLGVSTKN